MKWCDRALVVSPYCYGLCLSEKDFHKTLKKLKLPKRDFMLNDRSHATLHILYPTDSHPVAIVCLADTKGKETLQIYGLIVHEATHIWQAIKENYGENAPSHEFEAYSMQTISQLLMHQFDEAMKKRKKGK